MTDPPLEYMNLKPSTFLDKQTACRIKDPMPRIQDCRSIEKKYENTNKYTYLHINFVAVLYIHK
jgi:hypothetical protein